MFNILWSSPSIKSCLWIGTLHRCWRNRGHTRQVKQSRIGAQCIKYQLFLLFGQIWSQCGFQAHPDLLIAGGISPFCSVAIPKTVYTPSCCQECIHHGSDPRLATQICRALVPPFITSGVTCTLPATHFLPTPSGWLAPLQD